MDYVIDRKYSNFKLYRDCSTGLYILKCYYYEYYLYLWRTYRDIIKFKNFDSLVLFLKNNKNDETTILRIYIPENDMSFGMKEQLGALRPYEYITSNN